MLYTNTALEFNTNRRGDNVLEISSLYGHFISIGVDRNINPAITFVDRKFHKYLSIDEYTKERFRLINKKDDDIYIVLDTSKYKNFNCNSVIEVPEGTNDFTVLKNYHMVSRNNKCQWNIVILKWNKNKLLNSVLRWKDTSGIIHYITINSKGHLFHINQHKMERIVDKNIVNTKFKSLI